MSSSRGGARDGRGRARVAQVHDERVELAERRAAQARRWSRSASCGSPTWPGLGLHHHRGHVVADDVVQLARHRLVRCSSQAAWPRSSSASLLELAARIRDRSRRPAPPPRKVARNGATVAVEA